MNRRHRHVRSLGACLVLISLGCAEEMEGPRAELGDPSIGADPTPVDPGIICRDQRVSEVTLNGGGFSPVPIDLAHDPRLVLPTVALTRAQTLSGGAGDGTEVLYRGDPNDELNTRFLSWRSQEQMSFAVSPPCGGDADCPAGLVCHPSAGVCAHAPDEVLTGPLGEGIYDVRVENLNGSTAQSAGALAVIEKPTLASLTPPIVCLAQGPRDVTLAGSRFLTIEDARPTVVIEGVAEPFGIDPASLTDCTDIPHAGYTTLNHCTEGTMTLAEGSVPVGYPAVSVRNPETAACVSEEPINLRVVAPPEVTSVEPPLICLQDGPREVTLHGSGFLTIDGVLPTVTFADGVAPTSVAVAGCSDLPTGGGLVVEVCDELVVTLAQDSLAAGHPDITVENPPPAGCAQVTNGLLTIAPEVAITAVDPIGVCVGQAGVETLTITGSGFLTIDGQRFTLRINGEPVTPEEVTDCTDLDVDGHDVESCNTVVATVDLSGLPVGPVPIEIANPPPSDCASSASDLFQISPRPRVDQVIPEELCSDVPNDMVTLIGVGFATNAEVVFDGPEAGSVRPTTINVVSATQMELTFAEGLPADTYDVTVSNGESCSSTRPAALIVHPTPLVFFVDPPVVYNGITTEVTVYATGLDALAAAVELIDQAGTRIPLDTFGNPDPSRPNQILADVPAGLDAGTYEVSVTSIYDCVSSLNGELRVSDALTLDLAEVDPAFASPTVDTAITVRADDPPAGGLVSFVAVPRIYLNPTSDPEATATAVRATVFENAGTLNGIVPGGLVPGDYDVIAVNPTGEVGLLPAALTVTETEPPFVTSVAPASLDANTPGQPVQINGRDFGTSAQQMSVELDCRDFETGAVAPSGTAVVTAASPEQLDVTIDTSGTSAGTVCVVVVENPDGSAYRFSAVSIKEPSQNLNPWSDGPSLNEARRAPAVVAGRPTDRSRFVYVIGGDGGSEASAKSTVESSAVGVFGEMDDWARQENGLPGRRTFAEAVVVGDFIYLTGGDDGGGPTSSVLRSRVLEPRDAPEVAYLEATLGDGVAGVGPGVWYYRVAALFPDDDPSNPGGETLPGEVLTVQLPDIEDKIVLTLNWETIPGASGYRVYRSPMAGAPVTRLEAIGDTSGNSATSLVDDGRAADPETMPLPQGSLGVWHPVSSMGVARSAHATVAVRGAGANTWYLYAAGGRSGNGVTNSMEYTTITVHADGSQSVAPWRATTAALGDARAELGGFVMTQADTNLIASASTKYVFFSQGRGSGNRLVSTFERGTVAGDGDITALDGITGPTPTRAGGTDLQANGWLFILGGSNGRASNGNDTSAELITAGGGLDSWDALGPGSMIEPRINMGSTKESAFFFIVGGSGSSDALATVEQTIQ